MEPLAEIHAKCVEYGYATMDDNSLATFVFKLVQSGQSTEDVNQELAQLVGEDYDTTLTTWIFERINGKSNHSYNEETSDKNVTPKTARISRGHYAFKEAMKNVQGNEDQRQRRSDRSRSRSPDHAHRSSRHAHRSRSRSPRRDQISSNRRHEDRYHSDRHDRRDRPSVFSRLGRQEPQAREGRPREDNSSQPDRHSHDEMFMSRAKQAGRCRFWPNCTSGDSCRYFHPTETCPRFPDCDQPANQCLYIHPDVSLYKPSLQQSATMTTAALCRFYPHCANPNCPFFHPPCTTESNRVPIECKNGEYCTRPNCHFLHPGDENPVAEILCAFDGRCTRPGCLYRHTVAQKKGPGQNMKLVVKNSNTERMNERMFSVPDSEIEERITIGRSADLIKPTK